MFISCFHLDYRWSTRGGFVQGAVWGLYWCSNSSSRLCCLPFHGWFLMSCAETKPSLMSFGQPQKFSLVRKVRVVLFQPDPTLEKIIWAKVGLRKFHRSEGVIRRGCSGSWECTSWVPMAFSSLWTRPRRTLTVLKEDWAPWASRHPVRCCCRSLDLQVGICVTEAIEPGCVVQLAEV